MHDAWGVPSEELRAALRPAPVEVTRTYTDWGPFWRGGYHTLLQGRTGSGKTTLLLTMLRGLHQVGHRILMRDDGGLDFLYLSPEFPMVVWVPEGCSFEADSGNVEVRGFTEPGEILDEAYSSPQRFHAVLYDCFCSDPGPAAGFYSSLFQELIYRCMQTERAVKEPLVFSFDELNDLIQPRGMEITKDHTSIRSMVEYNVRKLRKHRVTLVASTHRFNQVGINVRSQFSYIVIKQSYGKDIYDFISHNLVTAANEAFWAILRDVTTMGPEYAYAFDYRNSYDKLVFPDIPRPLVRYRLEGKVESEARGKRFDPVDLYIVKARAVEPPESYRSIAARVGLHESTVRARYRKIVEEPLMKL